MKRLIILLLLGSMACEDPTTRDVTQGEFTYRIDKLTQTCFLVREYGPDTYAVNVDCNKLPYITKIKFGLIKAPEIDMK